MNRELQNQMPKILVVNLEDTYPFHLRAEHNDYPSDTPILIRETFSCIGGGFGQLKAKISFAKNLRNKHLVKIQSIMEESQCMHILYEHIESHASLNSRMTKVIFQQMKEFTKYLSNIGVRIQVEGSRIGVDEKNLVKYFMGVDFQWEESQDQSVLPQHYQNELIKVFGPEMVRPSAYQMVPFQNLENDKNRSLALVKSVQDRKSSFATLPSRFNRLYQIDKKLKSMFGDNIDEKSQIDYSPNHHPINLLRNHKSQQSLKPMLLRPPPERKNEVTISKAGGHKKFLDRKFSGDAKLTIVSNKRLYEKETDIRSERGMEITTQTRISRRRNEQNCLEEVETIQSKSRIDQMKHQQYLQITKSNKGYLKDFLSVLEDEEQAPSQMHTFRERKLLALPAPNHLGKSIECRSQNNEMVPYVNAGQLQRKARDAISNSMKAIQKFRAFGKD